MSYNSLIQGPVIPVPTFFNNDDSVDYSGLTEYARFLSESGISTIMTTVGTSRYNLLSWDEIKLNNEALVKGCGPNTKSIVANPTTGSVQVAIEFGKHAEKIGADFYLVYFPERHYGEDNTYEYFKLLNDALNIKILIHEMPMRNGFGGEAQQYSVELLERLFELENIVGVKEEALDAEYSNMLVEKFASEYVIIGAGGGMSRYLYRDFDRGAKAFLGGIGNFYPELELEFFQAITSGNQERAKQIVEDIELKYFVKVVPLGWHPSLKIALGLKGLGNMHERRPMKRFTEGEIEEMRVILKEFNWL